MIDKLNAFFLLDLNALRLRVLPEFLRDAVVVLMFYVQLQQHNDFLQMRAPVLAVELVRMPSALALAFGMVEAESL